VAAVVEQQAAHIPAEWLLQLGRLLRSHARLSGDLRIARRLDDCRIGCGRRGSRDRYGGSARPTRSASTSASDLAAAIDQPRSSE
jgi:hypothetical protein